MDKKTLTLLGALWVACAVAGIAESKGFDTNSLPQETPMPEAKTSIPELPAMTEPASLSGGGSTSKPVIVETSFPAPKLTDSVTSMPAVPGFSQKVPSLKTRGFRVPEFTDRNPLTQAARQKKKKSLWEKIEYEVSHYALLLLLGFAVVLLVYALRREAAEHAAPPEEKPGEKVEPKKSLWEDQF